MLNSLKLDMAIALNIHAIEKILMIPVATSGQRRLEMTSNL